MQLTETKYGRAEIMTWIGISSWPLTSRVKWLQSFNLSGSQFCCPENRVAMVSQVYRVLKDKIRSCM